MRILYLQQLLVLPGRPGNARCFEFAKAWVAAGHEVCFLSSTAGIPADHPFLKEADDPLHFWAEGVEIKLIPVDYAHKMSFSKRIRSFIGFYRKAWRMRKELGNFDILLAYSAPLSVGDLGRRMAAHLGIPWVFEVADVWPDVPIGMGIIRSRILAAWLQYRTRKMYRAARQVMVFSEGMKAQVQSHKIPDEKVKVVHNGCDIHRISFQERPDRTPISIIYTGTIGIANDLSQIVQVAHRIHLLGRKDIQFLIIGTGNDEANVKTQVRQLQLNNLQFLEQVPKEALPEYFERADIGISSFAPFPVLEANSATKFYDYLAAGLPIVLNYEGWQAVYLKKYGGGLSSPQGQLESFVENILQLADDYPLRKQYGQEGRVVAEQFFDRRNLAQKALEILEKSLNSAKSEG